MKEDKGILTLKGIVPRDEVVAQQIVFNQQRNSVDCSDNTKHESEAQPCTTVEQDERIMMLAIIDGANPTELMTGTTLTRTDLYDIKRNLILLVRTHSDDARVVDMTMTHMWMSRSWLKPLCINAFAANPV